MQANKFSKYLLFSLALFLGISVNAAAGELIRNHPGLSLTDYDKGLSLSSPENIFLPADKRAGDENFFLPGTRIPPSVLMVEHARYAGVSIFNGTKGGKAFSLLHSSSYLSLIKLFSRATPSLSPSLTQILLLLFLYHFFW